MTALRTARVLAGLLAGASLALLSVPAVPASKDVATALRQYEQHRYAEAARSLRDHIPADGQNAQAWLALGMIYLKNAELHAELAAVAVDVQIDYLKKLAARKGAGRSRAVDLYLGEALRDAGRPREAATHIARFRARPKQDAGLAALAPVSLGLAQYQSRNTAAARATWAGVTSKAPEVRAALAAAYAISGHNAKQAVALADDAAAARANPGARMVKDLIAVYSRNGRIDKALELADGADLRAPSHVEGAGSGRVIHFYDLALLGELARLYAVAGLAALERAAGDAAIKPTADYYLARGHAALGELDRAQAAAERFLAVPDAPARFRDLARIHQAGLTHRRGDTRGAMTVWQEYAGRGEPELLAEVIAACTGAGADCGAFLTRAAAAADAGQGRKFAPLNVAIGRAHLARKEYAKALAYLEAGRDKSKKNKIEGNDPVMLVGLAEAYYRTKQYSENLEIYFEMSKQFPAVRQIQEAMQGIYAVEHKSAGDVKIF